MSIAKKIVDKMYQNDAFSQWLGIEVIEIKDGLCRLRMIIREEMLNGFQIAHGGIAYSLADTALAFASNSYGRKSLSIETSISHTASLKVGDVLTAETKELSMTDKIGIYLINIKNQNNKEVAIFKGTIFRTSQKWITEH